MATTLGGTVLGEPAYGHDGYELETLNTAIQHDLCSGGTVIEHIAARYRITLRWKAITLAAKNAIRAKAEVYTSQTLITPDGDTYTVFVVPGSWKEAYIEAGDGVDYYSCEFQCEEAA